MFVIFWAVGRGTQHEAGCHTTNCYRTKRAHFGLQVSTAISAQSFAREMWLTRHKNFDNGDGNNSYKCLFVRAFGVASLVLNYTWRVGISLRKNIFRCGALCAKKTA